MKRKSIMLVLVLVLSMVFVSCGNSAANGEKVDAPATTTEGGTGEDTSLTYITERGEFILGLDASFPPMGFTDDDLEIVGFDVDVAKEVCKRMGVTLKLQSIDWKAKEQELNTKNIDCIWNGFSYSEERNNALTLSTPYMTNTQVAVVLTTSKVETLSDLAGKVVAIQNGSTASDAMDANKEFTDSLKELVKVDDNVQAMMDLKINGSDAVVMDEVVARYYTEQEPGTYKILDETLSDEQYVIGFRKGDEALRDEVEKYLKEMKADGTLAEISTTWFGKDITTVE